MEKIFDRSPVLLIEYLLYLKNIKNYSLNTIKSYALDLLTFFNFIKKYNRVDVPVKDFNLFFISSIKEDAILAFLVYLNYHKNSSSATRQRYVISIKRFYDWLFYYKLCCVKENPAKNIPHIVQTERLPKYLCLDYAQKITKIFTIENSRYPARNNAIISVFLNCGLRVSELVNINVNDLNIDDNFIHITGKGKKERKVYLNKSTKDILNKYINFRNKINTSCCAFFLNHSNKRLTSSGVENICKKAYCLAGLTNFNYTVHTLRHTASTLMYQYGNVDIRALQELLGHESISTTEIYTHIDSNVLREAVDRNPLNYMAA